MKCKMRFAVSIFMVATVVLGALALVLAIPPAEAAGLSCRCPAVWDPVICSDGHVYSNACWARCSGAHGCKPYGGGPIP